MNISSLSFPFSPSLERKRKRDTQGNKERGAVKAEVEPLERRRKHITDNSDFFLLLMGAEFLVCISFACRHYPTTKATAVAQTPESMRLKKQSERQSVVAYHKAHEDDKGKYTAVADDVHVTSATKQQAAQSQVKYDQRGADERQQQRTFQV